MTNQGAGSLSFLDVLTCGLGGIIMLFLVIMALNPNISSRREPERIEEKKNFAVIVEFAKGGLARGSDPWVIQNEGETKWTPEVIQSGPGFAILVSDSLPPDDTKIQLVGIQDNSSLSVRHSNGTELVALEYDRYENRALDVWPMSARRKR